MGCACDEHNGNLGPLRRRKSFVYSKPPFAGSKAVLAYLARYTHRVAISNRRLIRADADSITFKVKDSRRGPGPIHHHDAGDVRVYPALP